MQKYIDLAFFLVIFTEVWHTKHFIGNLNTYYRCQPNFRPISRINSVELRKTPYSAPSHHNLSQLPPNCEAVIASITAPPRLAARLRELGFLPGQPLRVLRAGSALIVQIGESRLALRRNDAAAIHLVP